MELLNATLIVFSLSSASQASPLAFKNCKSELLIDHFHNCPGGEGGTQIPCDSQTTKLGSATVDFTASARATEVKGNITFTPAHGSPVSSPTRCFQDPTQGNWMDCESTKSFAVVGKLTFEYATDGIQPGIFFAQIFSDKGNVPLGEFQTSMDCHSN